MDGQDEPLGKKLKNSMVGLIRHPQLVDPFLPLQPLLYNPK